MRAVVLVGLIACYAPNVQLGAPCNTKDESCPPSQSCVAGFCAESTAGAPGDGPGGSPDAFEDRDGDGVPDALDNCPDVANADQANEDGDTFGDVCDPCPVEANDTPSDPDGDGVADGCDPHPMVAGDKIALFEGFHDGIPTTWQIVGNVTAGSDAIALVNIADDYTAVVPPLDGLANATVSASLIVDSQVGSADSTTAITLPYDAASDQGIFCELYAPLATSTAGRYVSIWDSPKELERGSADYAWTTATPYRIALTRTGTTYTCTVTPPTGAVQTATGSTNATTASAHVAVTTYGADAHAQWLMVVTSP